jgi:hypothetical protein
VTSEMVERLAQALEEADRDIEFLNVGGLAMRWAVGAIAPVSFQPAKVRLRLTSRTHVPAPRCRRSPGVS